MVNEANNLGPHNFVIVSDILALDGVQDLGDFYFVPGLDSHNADLNFEETTDVEVLKKRCRENPNGRGFNTLGFLKWEILPPHELAPSEYFSDGDGLYIFKERYVPGYTFFGNEVPKMVGAKPVIKSYTKPASQEQDMMVILPFFNFAHSYRTTQNLLYVRETLRNSGIPYLVVELAFSKDPFWLAPGKDIVQVRTESRMFYKENLLRLGVEHTPKEFSKFCFLDADILFSDPNWYVMVSDLLNQHAAVHPYTNRYYLSPDLQIEGLRDYSTLLYEGVGGSPGFAWAVTRNWIEEQGIFDYCVIGGGDRVFSYCFGHQNFLLDDNSYRYLGRLFSEYTKRGPKRPAVCAPTTIFHMFHGSPVKRQYDSRNETINSFLSRHELTDAEEILERRPDGLLEWREEYRPELNELLGQYFQRRDDDSL